MDKSKISKLDKWEVLAIDGKGLYIRGGGDPWRIVAHERLMRQRDELSEAYRKAIK